MATLVDTGPLFALAHETDRYHEPIKKYFSTHRDTWIVPAPVVTETCIGILDRLGADAELAFLRSLAAKEMLVQDVAHADLTRSRFSNSTAMQSSEWLMPRPWRSPNV